MIVVIVYQDLFEYKMRLSTWADRKERDELVKKVWFPKIHTATKIKENKQNKTGRERIGAPIDFLFFKGGKISAMSRTWAGMLTLWKMKKGNWTALKNGEEEYITYVAFGATKKMDQKTR